MGRVHPNECVHTPRLGGFRLGAAFVVGAAGVAIAAVPRDSELARQTNAPLLLRGFRRAGLTTF